MIEKFVVQKTMGDIETKFHTDNKKEISHELLIFACQNGYLNITKNILECGNINPSLENNSALVYASASGYTDIVKLLLKDKRINICDNNDYKCFYVAIENQHMMTAILILGYISEKKGSDDVASKQLTVILENLFRSKYNEAEKQLHKNLMIHLLKKYSN